MESDGMLLLGKANENNLLRSQFQPTDQDLIRQFLAKKAADARFRSPAIREVDQVVDMGIYKCEPWDLPHRALDHTTTTGEEATWYFFCRSDARRRWERNCMRTASGYWAAARRDEEILDAAASITIGTKRTLVFYRGRAPDGERTNWVMHEYRIQAADHQHHYSYVRTNVEEWVICRVSRVSSTDEKVEEQLPAAAPPSSSSSSSSSSSLWPELKDASSVDQMTASPCMLQQQSSWPFYRGTEQQEATSSTSFCRSRMPLFPRRRGPKPEKTPQSDQYASGVGGTTPQRL